MVQAKGHTQFSLWHPGLRRAAAWPAAVLLVFVSAGLTAADLVVEGSQQTTISSHTTVAGAVIVRDNGRLTVNGAVLTVDGDVWLENSGL